MKLICLKLYRSVTAFGLILIIVLLPSAQAYASYKSDLQSIYNGTAYYDPDSSSSSSCSTSSTPSGDTTPLHVLAYPAIQDEKAAAAAIDAYISRVGQPNSPFKGMGDVFVSGGKRHDINPFLAVAQLTKETGLARSLGGDSWAYNSYKTSDAAMAQDQSQKFDSTYNAFGMSRTSSPQGYYKAYDKTTNTWYIRKVYVWPNWKASIDSSYGGNEDWYQILSSLGWFNAVHATNDLTTYFNKYADNSATYGPDVLKYMDNIASGVVINGNGASTAGSDTSSSSCSTPDPGSGASQRGVLGGDGKSSNGYAFPLAPQTHAVRGIKDGQTISAHQGGPAFDLYNSVSATDQGGDDVYALTNGTIWGVGEDDPGWCYNIQLKADAPDGHYYWYGHLNYVSPKITKGARVYAGQVMAEVAQQVHGTNTPHNCNGSSPGPSHLHIDEGCTTNGKPQTGGRSECRDPAFIPFLSKIYEGLPQ